MAIDPTELLLSFQRALLGSVRESRYAVVAAMSDDGTRIDVYAYSIGPPSRDDELEIHSVGTEVIADFPDVTSIEEHFINVLETPEVPIHPTQHLVFCRATDERTQGVRFFDAQPSQ